MNAVATTTPGATTTSTRPSQPNVLWRRINDRIEQRMVVLERGVVSLLERPLRPPEVESCVAEATLLTKWLFALDLVSAGRLAREISQGFASANLSNREAATLSARIDDLRRDLQIAADDWATTESTTTHVHVVSPIDARIDAVMWHLQQQGVLVTHSPTYLSAPENADAIAVYSPTNIRDSRALLVGIGRRSSSIRRVAIHDLVGDAEELTGVSSHSDLILSLSVHPKEIADEIHSISLPDPSGSARPSSSAPTTCTPSSCRSSSSDTSRSPCRRRSTNSRVRPECWS